MMRRLNHTPQCYWLLAQLFHWYLSGVYGELLQFFSIKSNMMLHLHSLLLSIKERRKSFFYLAPTSLWLATIVTQPLSLQRFSALLDVLHSSLFTGDTPHLSLVFVIVHWTAGCRGPRSIGCLVVHTFAAPINTIVALVFQFLSRHIPSAEILT